MVSIRHISRSIREAGLFEEFERIGAQTTVAVAVDGDGNFAACGFHHGVGQLALFFQDLGIRGEFFLPGLIDCLVDGILLKDGDFLGVGELFGFCAVLEVDELRGE